MSLYTIHGCTGVTIHYTWVYWCHYTLYRGVLVSLYTIHGCTGVTIHYTWVYGCHYTLYMGVLVSLYTIHGCTGVTIHYTWVYWWITMHILMSLLCRSYCVQHAYVNCVMLCCMCRCKYISIYVRMCDQAHTNLLSHHPLLPSLPLHTPPPPLLSLSQVAVDGRCSTAQNN